MILDYNIVLLELSLDCLLFPNSAMNLASLASTDKASGVKLHHSALMITSVLTAYYTFPWTPGGIHYALLHWSHCTH